MNTDDSEHLNELITVLTKRLQKLEVRAAQEGWACPPEVAIEIEGIAERINQIKQRLDTVPTQDFFESKAALRAVDQALDVLDADVRRVEVHEEHAYHVYRVGVGREHAYHVYRVGVGRWSRYYLLYRISTLPTQRLALPSLIGISTVTLVVIGGFIIIPLFPYHTGIAFLLLSLSLLMLISSIQHVARTRWHRLHQAEHTFLHQIDHDINELMDVQR